MKTCPACSEHSWADDVLGTKSCPQCRARVNLKPGAITEAPRAFRVVHRPTNKKRDSIPVKGKVLCAACGKPSPLGDSYDGAVETDGTMMVSVQVGWRLIGETFHPATEQRYIPRRLRGMFCRHCMVHLPWKPVGRMETPKDEKAESILSDVRTNGLPRELDPDPTWAHSKDSTWLAGANAQEPWYDDSPPIGPWGDLECVDRVRYRGPLFQVKRAFKPFAPIVFGRTPTPPWYPSETLNRLVALVTAHWGV